jgi:hypothetical protein
MLKKFLLPFFISLALLSATPVIRLDRLSHSFGTISPNGKVAARFQVFNDGGTLLQLIRVETYCECTSALPGKSFLEPGESMVLDITYDPSGQKGAVTKDVSIITNDPQHPVIHLTLEGVVVPAISLSQDDLFFPDLLPSDRRSQTVRCASSQGRAVRLLGTTGPLPSFVSMETAVDGNDAQVILTIDGSKLPSNADMGRELVQLRTDDEAMPLLSLTLFWAKGRAILPQPFRIVFEPGAPQTMMLTLKQTHNRPFRILGAFSQPPVFAVEGLTDQILPQHTLVVRLLARTPSTSLSGQIVFQTDDPDEPEVVIEAAAIVP